MRMHIRNVSLVVCIISIILPIVACNCTVTENEKIVDAFCIKEKMYHITDFGNLYASDSKISLLLAAGLMPGGSLTRL